MRNLPLLAFRDHGSVGPTLDLEPDQAQEALDKLVEVGIDLDKITQQLQEDGVESFVDSFKKLIARIEGKRKLLISGFLQRQKLVLGMYQKPVEDEIAHHPCAVILHRRQHLFPAWMLNPRHAQVMRIERFVNNSGVGALGE